MVNLHLTDANQVTWTPKDMAVVHIKYDEDFWIGRMLSACVIFLGDHVVPASIRI